jgi:hypothetical protein
MLKRLARHVAGNAVAWIALFVALGGASYAAVRIPANSVGTRQLKRNAVTSSRVKDRSLVAKDFRSGQLPKGATGAAGAKGDPGATGPIGPSSATEAFVDGAITANAGAATTIATLNGLAAGAYVITAKTVGRSTTANDVESSCTLTAGGVSDVSGEHFNNGAPAQTQVNELTQTLAAPGAATLSCTPTGNPASYAQTKIVAIKLGAETHAAG